MPSFDRFDICAAFNLYAVGYNGEPYANKIHVRLAKIKYRPSRSEEYLCGISENAREVYATLVQAHHTDHTGYNPCACRDCFDVAIGVQGVAMCHACESAGCEPGCGECDYCRERGHECHREDAYEGSAE